MKFRFSEWSSSQFDFARTFADLVEHSEDKESHIFWLSENSKLLASDLFNNLSNGSSTRTRQLTKILQYLKSKNCSPRSFTPKNLSIDEWGSWLQICDRLHLDDDSEIFSFISLSEKLTREFIGAFHTDVSGLNGPPLYALHRSVTLFPEDPNWRALADRTFQWFQQHSGNPELDSLYTLVFTLLLKLDRDYTENLRSVVSKDIFWQRLQNKEILCLNYLALIYMADNYSNNLPENADVKVFWNDEHEIEKCNQTLNFAEALSCTDEIWHLAKAGMAHAKQIILQSESATLFSGKVGSSCVDKLSEGGFEESEIRSVVEKLKTAGSFEKILSEITKEPMAHKKIIVSFHKFGDTETKKKLQKILKTMSEADWDEWIKSGDGLPSIAPNKSLSFTNAYEKIIVNLASQPRSAANSEPLEFLSSVKSKLLDFNTVFSAAVLRAYFGASEDFLSEDDFSILIPNLIHELGSVDVTQFQDRLLNWLQANRFARIETVFSSEIKNLSPFRATSLERFREQLADRIDSHEGVEQANQEIQQLRRLQTRLAALTNQAGN